MLAAVGTYLVAYRFYSRFLAAQGPRPRRPTRATPAERLSNGRDFVPTTRWVLFGHHFAAIAGAGPLVGPVLAAQFGYLPGTLWIVFGVVLGGAVQDFVILFASMRRDGKSLGQMAKEEIGPVTGLAAMVAILAIMIILLAVLALVVVNALARQPVGHVHHRLHHPDRAADGLLDEGVAARAGRWRPPRSGVVLLMARAGRRPVRGGVTPRWRRCSRMGGTTHRLAHHRATASWRRVLPVWMLLCPARLPLHLHEDRHHRRCWPSGSCVVLPPLKMPALTQFIDGTGPVFAGKLFPFAFITIACGAISGFHALVARGTTPKMLRREGDARLIGYGGMLMESFVAVMAMCAAAVLDPGVYFAINAPLATLGGSLDAAAETIRGWGFTVTPEQMEALAASVGETTLLARTGGAPSLAVGMAQIFAGAFGAAADGALVPLRHHVRGAVHPDHGGHRHPRRPLHAPGAGSATSGSRWAAPRGIRAACSPRRWWWPAGATS